MGKKIRSVKRELEAVIHGKLYVTTSKGCWEFPPWCRPGSYATFSLNGKSYLAHREVWRLWRRPIPAGVLICHHCDNPWCFNPGHLFEGTYATNSEDCIAKGRGARLRFTALSAEDLNYIRTEISLGSPAEDIMTKYKLSRARVMRIAQGKEQPTRYVRRAKDK
jgi:hypothetical protein